MKIERALSLDIDGVVVARIPVQLKALRDYRKYGTDLFLPPPVIPILDRTVSKEPLKTKEAISCSLTSLRFVFPQVRKTLSQLDGVDLYGNTGRPNQKDWIDMTKSTLERGGILKLFNDIFFKPDGVSTTISKAEAICQLRERYSKVTHIDDNPADALPIAARFPDVDVVVLQDLTTGILFSKVEMDKFPNVRRIAVFRDALPNQTRLQRKEQFYSTEVRFYANQPIRPLFPTQEFNKRPINVKMNRFAFSWNEAMESSGASSCCLVVLEGAENSWGLYHGCFNRKDDMKAYRGYSPKDIAETETLEDFLNAWNMFRSSSRAAYLFGATFINNVSERAEDRQSAVKLVKERTGLLDEHLFIKWNNYKEGETAVVVIPESRIIKVNINH